MMVSFGNHSTDKIFITDEPILINIELIEYILDLSVIKLASVIAIVHIYIHVHICIHNVVVVYAIILCTVIDCICAYGGICWHLFVAVTIVVIVVGVIGVTIIISIVVVVVPGMLMTVIAHASANNSLHLHHCNPISASSAIEHAPQPRVLLLHLHVHRQPVHQHDALLAVVLALVSLFEQLSIVVG